MSGEDTNDLCFKREAINLFCCKLLQMIFYENVDASINIKCTSSFQFNTI